MTTGSNAWIDAALTARFKERTQAEWSELFAGTDACVAPVVPLADAPQHPHLMAERLFQGALLRDGRALAAQTSRPSLL